MTIDTSASLGLVGQPDYVVTFEDVTSQGRIRVNIEDADGEDPYGDGPYIYGTDGKHYKGLHPDLINTAAAETSTSLSTASAAGIITINVYIG